MTTTISFTDEMVTVNAAGMTTAWVNAFLATGQGGNPALSQTLSVEFFPRGVQLIACDGTMLFCTWVPSRDQHTEQETRWPHITSRPMRSIVVMDEDHFALAFIKTLMAATADFESAELSLAIERIEDETTEATPPLGDGFAAERLTLRALGQQLHCKLYDGPYPDWRAAAYGIEPAERVDGMQLATRLFATVGKLKKVASVELSFNGEQKRIAFIAKGDTEVRGLLMPMRRAKEKAEKAEEDAEQTDALEGTQVTSEVKVGGKWVPATQENIAKATANRRNGRDRAAGSDES